MTEEQNRDTTTSPEEIDRLKKIILFVAPIVTLSFIGLLAFIGFVESLGLLVFIAIVIGIIVGQIIMIKMIFRVLDDET